MKAPFALYPAVLLAATLPAVLAIAFGIRPPDLGRVEDIYLAGQGLLAADGFTPDFKLYGYPWFILLGWWYRLLHAAGLLAMAAPQGLVDAASFRDVIAAALALQAVMAGAAVLLFHGIARRLSPPWTAVALTVVFGGSLGLGAHVTFVAGEMASGLFLLAACRLLFAAMEADGLPGLGYLMLVAAFGTLAVMQKSQAVLLVMAMPWLTVWLARPRPTVVTTGAMAAIPLAAAFALPAWVMLVGAWRGAAYQPALAVMVLAAMAIVVRRRGQSWRDVALAASAVAVGVAAAQLLHLIAWDPAYTGALVNWLEHLSQFGSSARPGPSQLARNLGTLVVDKGLHVDTFAYPFRLFYVLAVVGAALLIRRRRWRALGLMAVFTGMAVGAEVAFLSRYHSLYYWPWYFIFIEPWLLLGLATAAGELGLEPRRPATRGALLAGAGLFAALGMADALQWAPQWRAYQAPSSQPDCEQVRAYIPKLAPYLEVCRG
jgi:hypothetical protein